MSASGWKRVGLLVLVVFLVIVAGAFDSPEMEVYGVGVPAWLALLVAYVLGVGAGVAAARSPRTGR